VVGQQLGGTLFAVFDGGKRAQLVDLSAAGKAALRFGCSFYEKVLKSAPTTGRAGGPSHSAVWRS
jgi:hypothetical protein